MEQSNSSPDDPGDGEKKDKDADKSTTGSTQLGYYPKPEDGLLPGFPEAGKGKYNPSSGRFRWKLPNGDILEWDKQHGEVEWYDKNGKNHKGGYDPNTGDQVSRVKNRETPKFSEPLKNFGLIFLELNISTMQRNMDQINQTDWKTTSDQTFKIGPLLFPSSYLYYVFF